MRLRKRAAEHGEILGENEDLAAVDRAPSGHHAIARHPGLLHTKISAAVLDEHVELLEALWIEEKLDALARSQLTALVLGTDTLLPSTKARLGTSGLKFVENGLHCSSAP